MVKQAWTDEKQFEFFSFSHNTNLVMNRYLLNISYIGTQFLGLQKLTKLADVITEDPLTVQGQLEMQLRKLKRLKNAPSIISSSRTDAGVHALHSTVHVDLERYGGAPYSPTQVTSSLNSGFYMKNVPIRVIKTYRVPMTFHCREAISRTYLYRIAVPNIRDERFSNAINYMRLEEMNRCVYLCSKPFDVDKFREASKLFLGLHDFRTFMGRSEDKNRKDKITRRVMERLELIKVNSPEYTNFSWPSCVKEQCQDFTHYHIIFKSPGFLYKQVRRTLGALIGAAEGTVNCRDIRFMLEVPSLNSWHPSLKSAQAHGLYLSEVAYKEAAYKTFVE